jgi:phosphatidylserine/phosphatidylglycerophosphate/cardiolipin synthase-like enzyme
MKFNSEFNIYDVLLVLTILILVIILAVRISYWIRNCFGKREEIIHEFIYTKSPDIQLQSKLFKAMRLYHLNPSERVFKIMESLLNSATESIYIAMYSMTHKQLAEILILARRRGVHVIVILQKNQDNQENRNSQDVIRDMMMNAGIIVQMVEKVVENRELMHLKMCMIDVPKLGDVLPSKKSDRSSANPYRTIRGQVYTQPLELIKYAKHGIIITGSMNWTYNGIKHNEENVVISSDKKACIKSMERFEELWTEITATRININ